MRKRGEVEHFDGKTTYKLWKGYDPFFLNFSGFIPGERSISYMTTGTFIIKCSKATFTEEEIDILEQHGTQFQRLINGERAPKTDAQRRFIEVAKGNCQPHTIYEKTWSKYNARLDWEAKPANKAAMGDRRKLPNDREEWKKMRAANWSDMQKRSKGLDE